MKTISALYLAVLGLTFSMVRCYPLDPDLTASEIVEGSGEENTTSIPETETEKSSFDFDLPEVLKTFLNDTSNTTKINGVSLTGDPDELDHVDYSVDSNYDYYYDDANDTKPSSVKVSKVVSLVLKPASVKKENVSDSSDSSIFGDESEGNETDTSEIPPIILTKTITYEKDLTGNDTETSIDETGRDGRDVFSSSGIPAFAHAAGASDTSGTEHLSSPSTFAVASSDGFSSSSNIQDPSKGGTSFSSGLSNSDGADHSSIFDSGAVGSVHRREAPESDDDYEESESSTDINVHASVSSSAGNYNRKIYETVNTDLTQGSFTPSSNAEYDTAPQTFGSESGFEPSFSDVADQSNTYPSYETGEEGEFTTQATYDYEAALVQRQRIAELKRKFLEDEFQAAAAKADEETETATDYEYSDGLATETPALSLLPDAQRVIYY